MIEIGGTARRSVGVVGWLGRVGALVAVGCLGLALVAVQRGRAVQESSHRIVADVRRGNDLFGPVDLTSAQQTRPQLEALAQVLGQLGDATHADVELLAQTGAQVRTLAAGGGSDLGIARTLDTTTAAIAADVAGLRDVAVGGEAGAAEAAGLLKTISELVRALNTELARLDNLLAVLPELGS